MSRYSKPVKLHPDKDPKTHPDYPKLIEAMERGELEVSCPWWSEGHWENKSSGELFEGCSYRFFV